MAKPEGPTIGVKLFVDKEKKKVLFAESDKESDRSQIRKRNDKSVFPVRTKSRALKLIYFRNFSFSSLHKYNITVNYV